MNKYLVSVALALFACGGAWAQTASPSATPGGTAVGAASNAQSTGSASVTTSPTQTLTLGGTTYPADTTTRLKNAPQVFAPSMQPTTPCTSIISGGMSVVGFGLSLGGSYEDKECTRREFARVLAQMGYADAGLAVLCRNEEVAAAAPQLCKRSDYVQARAEDYIGSERPVMPPARVMPLKDAPPPLPATPVGAVGYGTNGQTFRFTGAAWVAEDVWTQQQAAATERKLTPKIETITQREGPK